MRVTLSRNSIRASAVLGGALAAFSAVTPANAVEPTLSFGTSFGGTSINHFTTVPNGALFDADIITLQPGINAGIVGLLADATPLDTACATGTFVLHPKTGAPEEIPVGTSCGIPFPFLVAASRPAGDYAEICAIVEVTQRTGATSAQRTETCFRFPND